MDAFISHSSANWAVAFKLEKALEATGLLVWLDDSEITLGALLGQELQDSIRASNALLLLWSGHAASSRWAIDPTDPSALNGLGSILMFRRDLDAAEFFILAAIAQADRQNMDYPEARHDLALVRQFK